MSTRIKTTGELRDFLAGVMLKVRSGEIELDKARSIAKLAGQINESFYAEIKVAAAKIAGGENQTQLGNTKIGSE